jgi:hypothetical protein
VIGPDRVGQRGIASDVDYVSRLARDLMNRDDVSAIISLCMAPFYSLVIKESLPKLQVNDPALSTALSQNVADVVARSRNALKLFEDKKPKEKSGISKNIKYFHEDIIPAHSERFLGNTWFPPVRFLETDLGLYKYGDRIVTTTHAATFYMGIDPRRLLGGLAEEIRSVYEEYGICFAKMGARLDASGPETFVKHIPIGAVSLHDLCAVKYYGRAFNGSATQDVNAVLTAFQAMMNFADTILIAGADVRSLEYSVFKFRYLTLYAVLASLRLLNDDASYPLAAASKRVICDIVDSPEALVITRESARPFRNTLMHYNLDSRIDPSQVDLAQPLFGIVPACFPPHNVESFADLVDRSVGGTAKRLDEWASARR